jgi:hypothetical protein
MPHGQHLKNLTTNPIVDVVARPLEHDAPDVACALAPRGRTERRHERDDVEHSLELDDEQVGSRGSIHPPPGIDLVDVALRSS